VVRHDINLALLVNRGLTSLAVGKRLAKGYIFIPSGLRHDGAPPPAGILSLRKPPSSNNTLKGGGRYELGMTPRITKVKFQRWEGQGLFLRPRFTTTREITPHLRIICNSRSELRLQGR